MRKNKTTQERRGHNKKEHNNTRTKGNGRKRENTITNQKEPHDKIKNATAQERTKQNVEERGETRKDEKKQHKTSTNTTNRDNTESHEREHHKKRERGRKDQNETNHERAGQNETKRKITGLRIRCSKQLGVRRSRGTLHPGIAQESGTCHQS